MGSGSSKKGANGNRRGGGDPAKGSQTGDGPNGSKDGPGGRGDNRDRDRDRGDDRRRTAPPYAPPYRDNTGTDDDFKRGGDRSRPTSAAPYRSRDRPDNNSRGLARSKSFDERAKLMDQLAKIANQTLDYPPGPVYNSPSYDASYDYYNDRVNANTQDELESWLDMELDTLKHRVVDSLLQAHYSIHDMDAVLDSAQMYEYRLQLAALVNVFTRENNEWERYNMQLDNERQQDLEFLRSLQDRVERGTTQRPVVMDTMSEYAQRNQKGRGNQNVYPTGGSRNNSRNNSYHNGEPPRRLSQQPGAASGSHVSDEAGRIISEYERSRQRAVDTRKQDRDRINRELDNYRRN